MTTRIRTAVIPAGGLGTRLLSLTRATSKELPVWKRQALDYALDEVPGAVPRPTTQPAEASAA